MIHRDWLIVVYNMQEEVRQSWVIKNRTEKEALGEAEMEIATIEGDVDGWTINPFAKEKLPRTKTDFDERYTVVTDSQELDHIVDLYGLGSLNREQITAAMVIEGDADYDEVWFTESSRPYLVGTEYMSLEYYTQE